MLRGVGMLGTGFAGAAGRGGPGITIAGGAFGTSITPAGIGCRGPDRICPGFGEGTGLAGIGALRETGGLSGMAGGPGGRPPVAESGGRNGCGLMAGAAVSSDTSFAGSTRAAS